jgi:Transglycosylase SLT domain
MTMPDNAAPAGNTEFELHFKQQLARMRRSATNVLHDIAQGFFEITHNGFAFLGLAVMFCTITLIARPDLREGGEARLMSWLQSRQQAVVGFTEPTAVERATASNPKNLPAQQASVTYWLSKKYGVAPEPLSVLVSHAFEIGQEAKLDPTLILAIMAIESGFNPFAQSPVGAQGLMQVMTTVHEDKYENFGGHLAAFDPVTNLRVGVKVLQECIRRAGSVAGGLKFYVGAGNLDDDGGYAAKVMMEHARLLAVVAGKRPPTSPLISLPGIAGPVPVSMPAKPAAEKVPSTPDEKSTEKSSEQVASLDLVS